MKDIFGKFVQEKNPFKNSVLRLDLESNIHPYDLIDEDEEEIILDSKSEYLQINGESDVGMYNFENLLRCKAKQKREIQPELYFEYN